MAGVQRRTGQDCRVVDRRAIEVEESEAVGEWGEFGDTCDGCVAEADATEGLEQQQLADDVGSNRVVATDVVVGERDDGGL